jgi:hypothetical protein
MQRPGRYFSWSEFEASKTAKRLDIDNRVVKRNHRQAIAHLCSAVLDPLRLDVGRPVRVTSGYRSGALNAALPSASPTSQHMRGQAADIKVDGVGAEELARRIVRLGLPFDQLIWYDLARGGHVHVSAVVGGGRGQTMHARAPRGIVPWQP